MPFVVEVPTLHGGELELRNFPERVLLFERGVQSKILYLSAIYIVFQDCILKLSSIIGGAAFPHFSDKGALL